MAVGDHDVVCGEGRQMVFVDPDDLAGRPLHRGLELTLEAVLAWRATAGSLFQVTSTAPLTGAAATLLITGTAFVLSTMS